MTAKKPRKIYFITSSENKFIEAKKIIPTLTRKSLDLVEIQSMDAKEIIREKLKDAKTKVKGDILVEDVSMELEAFNGFPGPLIRWMENVVGIDRISEICTSMKKTRARIICSLGLLNRGKEYFFEGKIEGNIVLPRGSRAFGFDPIFIPDGEKRTFGEMTKEEKQKYSHRGKAYMKLRKFLESNR